MFCIHLYDTCSRVRKHVRHRQAKAQAHLPPPQKKQVALYIDAARAAASPRLRPFAGQGRAELQGNESFYEAMMAPDVRG